MADNEHKKNNTRKIEGIVKGTKGYHSHQGYKYNIEINPTATKPSAVVIEGGGKWHARLDGPHSGTNVNHININKKISGKPDPHIELPSGPGVLEAGRKTARFCKAVNTANKVLVPIAIAVDTVRTAKAIHTDAKSGTSRNTVETVAGIAGSWGGGYAGASAGAAIGTVIFPVIGTIAFGIIGGLAGGILGATKVTEIVHNIGDERDFDIEKTICKNCQAIFKNRKYLGEKYELCESCRY